MNHFCAVTRAEHLVTAPFIFLPPVACDHDIYSYEY